MLQAMMDREHEGAEAEGEHIVAQTG